MVLYCTVLYRTEYTEDFGFGGGARGAMEFLDMEKFTSILFFVCLFVCLPAGAVLAPNPTNKKDEVVKIKDTGIT